MRPRRRHRDDWPVPSGLAEVELFRFWEADLAGSLPPEVVVLTPQDVAPRDVAGPGAGEPGVADDPPEVSADPLWWAAGLVFVAVLLAVLV